MHTKIVSCEVSYNLHFDAEKIGELIFKTDVFGYFFTDNER